MSAENSRLRNVLSRFRTILESIIIFLLLLSGIGVIFIGKAVIGAGIVLFSIALTVQIMALILVGLYFYFRFLRIRIMSE